MQPLDFDQTVEKIALADPRYAADAYYFIREALDHTQKTMQKSDKDRATPQHVTGPQLLEGIRSLALREFGPMAGTVFEEWGVTRCEDFGEIVFNMVDQNLLSKTADDHPDDFKATYTFEDAFQKPFLPRTPLPDTRRPARRQASRTGDAR